MTSALSSSCTSQLFADRQTKENELVSLEAHRVLRAVTSLLVPSVSPDFKELLKSLMLLCFVGETSCFGNCLFHKGRPVTC